MFTRLPQSRLVALDLETTGLNRETDRIVEMAAVRWEDGRETGHFQALVNPGCHIPASATAIHGITDAMVADCPSAAELLPAFVEFCQATAVIAHNAKFDIGFLRMESERTGIPLFTSPVLDSCAMARRRLPGMPNYRLETLTRLLVKKGKRQQHRALQDARDCLAVYLHAVQAGVPSPPEEAVTRPPDSAHLELLRLAHSRGDLLMIEYQDGRGRKTRRAIRPMQFDPNYLVVEAYCHLRNDTRHFYLDRICRVWWPE
ncbi:MAG: exonuclease domain-containing protein [Armatimonadota bacterium]